MSLLREVARVGVLALPLFGSHLCAQSDLSGEWAGHLYEDLAYRGPGAEIGEYLGLPINEAARMKADSWDAAVFTLPERQCIPFAVDHGLTIGNLRIIKEVDPETQGLIAWHVHAEYQAQDRTIWMDGRPHPPAWAPHTWQGFSTGRWEGPVLTVETTHLKMAQVERNGVPRSDLGTLTEHFIRNGDILTIVQIITDPIYLTEPFIRSRDYVFAPAQTMGGYPCRPAVEVRNRPAGYVPHHLPGANPFLKNATIRFNVPEEAARGGADTQYPEYQLKLHGETVPRVSLSPNPPVDRQQSPSDDNVHVTKVQGDLYMVATAGGNVAVQAGKDAVLVVDTLEPAYSAKLIAAIRGISTKPIRYIINTHVHADSTGGNETIGKAGRSIGANGIDGLKILGDQAAQGAGIIAHENVYLWMSTTTGATAVHSDAWPTETYAANSDELVLNGEAVQIFHEPAAHTDGDSIVFFRHSDVVAAGDLFSTESFPIIDRQNGGHINGIIAGLNHIIDITVPGEHQEGGTYVIPGHGRLADEADVVEYRDMLTIIRDRVQDMIRKRMTLAQVKAARPAMDYEGRYGASTGPWTTDTFLDAVYAGLSEKK